MIVNISKHTDFLTNIVVDSRYYLEMVSTAVCSHCLGAFLESGLSVSQLSLHGDNVTLMPKFRLRQQAYSLKRSLLEKRGFLVLANSGDREIQLESSVNGSEGKEDKNGLKEGTESNNGMIGGNRRNFLIGSALLFSLTEMHFRASASADEEGRITVGEELVVGPAENSSVGYERVDLLDEGIQGVGVKSESSNSDSKATAKSFSQVASAVQTDEINACEYSYPLALPSGEPLSWVESRKPERYSSAAPLSADARLRIVSERLELKSNLVFSVYVSPPNPQFLPPEIGQSEWTAKNVARSFLTDKTSPRMTSVQKLQESAITEVFELTKDGTRYFYFEFLNSKSPTFIDGSKDVFRHSLAVSVEREGYLYTLSVSALDSRWELFEDVVKATVDSFRLLPTTSSYVPPWKDPWRFW